MMNEQWIDKHIQRVAEIEEQLEQQKQEKQQQATADKESVETRVRTGIDKEKTGDRIVPLKKFQSIFEKANLHLYVIIFS